MTLPSLPRPGQSIPASLLPGGTPPGGITPLPGEAPPLPRGTPREGFPKELLPSGIYEEKPQSRKYLRRETDIPAEEFRQNPSQGKFAGRFVRIIYKETSRIS